jgi:hypothetical protein
MSTIITTIIVMFTACAELAPKPPNGQPDKKPPNEVQEDQHFCCERLGGDGKSGEGCISIDITHVGGCNRVLYCGGSYENDNGKVTCSS